MAQKKVMLTKTQRKEILDRARFWAEHAGHWALAIPFVVMTLGILYVLWGNDAVFAATILGG